MKRSWAATFCHLETLGMSIDLCTPTNAFGFAEEPLELEQAWNKITMQDRPTPKIWTDAYLVAFAGMLEVRLVTLDSGVLSIASDALLLLNPSKRMSD